MATLRWELFLTEKSRHGTYDLGIAYEVPDQQTDKEARKKIAAFRRLHRQCLRDRIPSEGTLRTEQWEDGSLVVKHAHVTSIAKIVKRARHSRAERVVSYKLYFRCREDADRLAKVVGFGSSPSLEKGSWCFSMPTEIRDDTDEWEEYCNPRRDPFRSQTPQYIKKKGGWKIISKILGYMY